MDLVTLFQKVKNNKKVKENGDEALVYSAFMLVLVFAGKFLTDFKFSAVITLGAAVQCLGFCLLRLKIRQQRGAMGISSRTLQMFAVMYVCRLYSTLQYNGYLPVDRTGDWVYQACEVAALAVCISVLAAVHSQHESTYEKAMDTCAIHWFFIGCFALAFLVHPHLNNHPPSDMCWAFALYLESAAVLCQFCVFMNQGKARPHITHFLAAQALSKFMSFIFWASSFSELTNKNHYIKELVAVWVVGMQMVQILIMVDFIHNYLYCMWYRIPVSQVIRGDCNV